ncbi:NAD-dependent protein deacetylase Sirt6, partial [Fragariocoptes setiger]
ISGNMASVANLGQGSPTLVSFIGQARKSRCGYCKKSGSVSHGMMCDRLLVQDYQHLLDRGWRRCGNYLYRPTNKLACCPAYTITCDAMNFKLSKSQRKCINRLNRYLFYDEVPARRLESTSDTLSYRPTNDIEIPRESLKDSSKTENQSSPLILSSEACAFLDRDLQFYQNSKKMKNKRMYHRLMRLMNGDKQMTYEEAACHIADRAARRRACRDQPKSLEDTLFPCEPSAPKHTLELKFHRASLTESKCKSHHDIELELLRRYQIQIHHDHAGAWSFARYSEFLIESPLLYQRIDTTNTTESHQRAEHTRSERYVGRRIALPLSDFPEEYGSYHCEYWLDNSKLIAVGVVDVLVNCLSSVYLSYDPDYSFLNLGVYSALREIDIVRNYCLRMSKDLNQYYMGFYIPSCPKMAYKIRYRPSQLLCDESAVFVDADKCLALLNATQQKYVRFNMDNPKLNAFECTSLTDHLLDMIQVYLHANRCAISLRKTIECIPEELKTVFIDRVKEYIRNLLMSVDYASGLSHYDDLGVCGANEIIDKPEKLEEKISILAKFIRECSKCTVHVGAGISTSAGIPDFRGPKGVWTKQLQKLQRRDADECIDKSKQTKEQDDEDVSSMSVSFEEATPTYTHLSICKMLEQKLIHYVVSQNVDGLFLRCGIPRKHISELHGNFLLDECTVCKYRFIRGTANPTIGLKKSAIKCPREKCHRGYLRDCILDWESPIPHNELRLAERESRSSDLNIVMGSTMQLMPAKKLPLLNKSSNRKARAKLVIINLQPTKLDEKADLVINSYVDNVMQDVTRLLGVDVPEFDISCDPTKNIAMIGQPWSRDAKTKLKEDDSSKQESGIKSEDIEGT